jgi:hypothetical protein
MVEREVRMTAALFSRWFVLAALAQAPVEADWLKVIPADVDVAVRARGLDAARADLLAMLAAMSPSWNKMADDALTSHFAEIRQRHGEQALKTPWVAVLRFGPQGLEGGMPFAVLFAATEYQTLIKEFCGGKDVDIKHDEAGFDSFEGPEGLGTLYSAKGPGIVAIGPAKDVIVEIARLGGKKLETVLSAGSAGAFQSGDAGLYVNAAALATRFADQIDQGRQALMGFLDQAAQQAGNEASMKVAKDLYGGIFDSLKYADNLTLNLDFAKTGLHLSGILNVKSDSAIARSIPEIHTGSAPTLGNFAPDAMAYVYVDLESKTFHQFQGMSLRMLTPEGKSSPAVDKAVADLHAIGRVETIGAVAMGGGLRGLNDITVSDPKKYIEASLAVLEAMKGAGGPGPVYKEVKVERDAYQHRGLSFTHVSLTIDLEQLGRLGGNNPAQAATAKAMFGGDAMHNWFGTDGKRLIQVMAPKWEDARAQVDTYLDGTAGIGGSAGFKAVRAQLPERACLLVLLSAQSLARMFATQFAAVTNNPNLKLPGDVPQEPALLGASLTPRAPTGFEFHLVLPSSVGTVVEKGMIPLFRDLQAARPNQ